MKKNLLSVLIASLALGLTACGEQNAPANTAQNAPAANNAPANVAQNAPAKSARDADKDAAEKVVLDFNKTVTTNLMEATKNFVLNGEEFIAATPTAELLAQNDDMKKRIEYISKKTGCAVKDLMTDIDPEHPTEMAGDAARVWVIRKCADGNILGRANFLARKHNGVWKLDVSDVDTSDNQEITSEPENTEQNATENNTPAKAQISADLRSQVERALAEITPAIESMDEAMLEGKTPTFSNKADPNTHVFLGVGDGKAALNARSTKTRYCLADYKATPEAAVISCELGKGTEEMDSLLKGKGIGWVRKNEMFAWVCVSTVAPEFLPPNCHHID